MDELRTPTLLSPPQHNHIPHNRQSHPQRRQPTPRKFLEKERHNQRHNRHHHADVAGLGRPNAADKGQVAAKGNDGACDC